MKPVLVIAIVVALLAAPGVARARSYATTEPGTVQCRVFVRSYVVVTVRAVPELHGRHREVPSWTVRLDGPASVGIVPRSPGVETRSWTLPSGWYTLTLDGDNCVLRVVVTQPRVGSARPLP